LKKWLAEGLVFSGGSGCSSKIQQPAATIRREKRVEWFTFKTKHYEKKYDIGRFNDLSGFADAG
jgi:hypothetical protein